MSIQRRLTLSLRAGRGRGFQIQVVGTSGINYAKRSYSMSIMPNSAMRKCLNEGCTQSSKTSLEHSPSTFTSSSDLGRDRCLCSMSSRLLASRTRTLDTFRGWVISQQFYSCIRKKRKHLRLWTRCLSTIIWRSSSSQECLSYSDLSLCSRNSSSRSCRRCTTASRRLG